MKTCFYFIIRLVSGSQLCLLICTPSTIRSDVFSIGHGSGIRYGWQGIETQNSSIYKSDLLVVVKGETTVYTARWRRSVCRVSDRPDNDDDDDDAHRHIHIHIHAHAHAPSICVPDC